MMHYFPGYKLYICGDDHFAYAQTLRELIAQVGENRVFLVGKVTDPEKNWLYAHAAAYFFPSRLEGFGIPGLEAMRFGCRVYASKLGSLPEVYENQACYWDSLEPEAMADVIRKDYPEWKKHPEKAEQAKIFSEQYNYDTYTQNYITLYRKLLGLTSE
jgi:glycosyltransferase involved in cell wall biosynthesis